MVCNLLHLTLQRTKILSWLPDFCNFCGPWSTVQIMKQLPQPNFRNMASLKLVHNLRRFGRASTVLSKAQEAHEVPLIKPSKALDLHAPACPNFKSRSGLL
jgi:hypothetical protein